MSPLLDHKQDETDIDSDAALQLWLKGDVATHGLPIAVEGEADQTSLLVEDRATRVAARNVVVGQETKLKVALGIGIRSEIAAAHQV